MKVSFFSAKPYEKPFFDAENQPFGHELFYHEVQLNEHTAILAGDATAVCLFVNDNGSRPVLELLHKQGVKLIALRSAGFNHIDLEAAKEFGMTVVRVPAYSPYAVAEHTLALMLTLNRKTHRAFNRVKEGNFALNGLLGFDLNGKTVGLIGLGKIGKVTAKILNGFGCKILGYDIEQDEEWQELNITFKELPELLAESDIISLHCPLTPETHHIINCDTLAQMKDGVMLINTSRGALIDTKAVIAELKTGKVGYLGLDVYEEEADLFFEDLSDKVIQDDVFMRLLTFPNVLITGHQAFFTSNAIHNIAETTMQNISAFEQGKELVNQVGE